MGSLYVPHAQAGWIDGRLGDIADDLTRGKPEIGWRGDPRLELHIGVLTDQRGRERERKIEVWRHNEDGTFLCIAWWGMHEIDRVLPDMVRMDVRTPGHVPVEKRIDAHNDAMERKALDQYNDKMGEMLEHALRLKHDREEGSNTFRQMPGTRDDPTFKRG